tara:strand:+ start:39 stop:362 length:324 start_codon:yes stop_codon:yes gene_type:complete
MYVSQLSPGMLIKLQDGFGYYIQESKKSSLPRLRVAPDVIVSMMSNVDPENMNPVMYLGETKEHMLKKDGNRGKLRTVMVDGQVAFVEGREFRNFSPVFDQSFSDNK